MRSGDFARHGHASGRSAGVEWALADPDRHPLHVWRRDGAWPTSYAATARQLGAAIATNGPLMGRRVWGVKCTQPVVIGALGTAAALTGAAGWTGSRPVGRLGATVARAGTAAATAAVGVLAAGALTLRGWVPCGCIHGAGARVRDTFDDEGPEHSWLGSAGPGFAGLRIGDGELPEDFAEGMGGLIRVVRNGGALRLCPHPAPADRTFVRLHDAAPAVAWGLVPHDGDRGVILVVSGASLSVAGAATTMATLGARDAVAVDPSGCAMLVVGGSMRIRPAGAHRQSIQTFGLMCGTPR